MCGIVGAVSKSNIVPMLIDGLKRLEYRGYDSAGVAIVRDNEIERKVNVGRVADLEADIDFDRFKASTGIAHTRWATHGGVTRDNAHPHISQNNVAVVHNGIIENHHELREELMSKGYSFYSQTDTEVIVNKVDDFINHGDDLLAAVQKTIKLLKGAYALGVICLSEPGRMIGARSRSPLLVGVKPGEAYLGSDMSALIAVTNKFMVLEDGDIVDINQGQVTIYNNQDQLVERDVKTSSLSANAIELGDYHHYMQKEIFEPGQAIADTLEGRISANSVLEQSFGHDAAEIFDRVEAVQIIACGTSFYSGLVARNWFEKFGVRCDVEIATEFSSRAHVVPANALVLTISQSGETIDTLTALDKAKQQGYRYSLTICNAAESSLVRASDLVFMTHAGPEIGVASTKAFTTQLAALLLLAIVLGRRKLLDQTTEAELVNELRSLPGKVEQALSQDKEIQKLATRFVDKNHALFLGRGLHFPIALEGALKLKEISYIHAEAYPAGELKHGPLALVDSQMPVIAVAPNNDLLEKIKSNIQEVRARGGQLIVFADQESGMDADAGIEVIKVAPVDDTISPIIYVIPLQLLAYHVAVIKGTDIDKPRNLAKSVTVE